MRDNILDTQQKLKQALKITQQSKQQLTRSLNFAQTGTWDLDVETNEIDWSDNVVELLGYKNTLTEITYDTFLQSVHHEDKQIIDYAIQRCLDYGEEYDIEHRIIWPDGSSHWLHVKGNALTDEQGKTTHILGLIRDISKQKQVLEELSHANKSKTEFLHNMSHELRTPLNSIIGFSKTMLIGIDGPINEEQQESLELIHNSGNHLLHLISEILDMSKIEAGKLILDLESADITLIISEMFKTLEGLASEKDLKLINNCHYEQIIITVDKIRLRQVFLNLLSNAIKFTITGSITLSVRTLQQNDSLLPSDINATLDSKITYLLITLEDTGIGIGSENFSKVFDQFQQIDHSSTKSVGGTGLGMPITKQLIEMHGGHIWLESKLGEGSTFSFILPVQDMSGICPG